MLTKHTLGTLATKCLLSFYTKPYICQQKNCFQTLKQNESKIEKSIYQRFEAEE